MYEFSKILCVSSSGDTSSYYGYHAVPITSETKAGFTVTEDEFLRYKYTGSFHEDPPVRGVVRSPTRKEVLAKRKAYLRLLQRRFRLVPPEDIVVRETKPPRASCLLKRPSARSRI